MKRALVNLLNRTVAFATTLAFLFLQLLAPIARAEENPLPTWLREEQGGWVPAEQAQRMSRADQELLDFLGTLENSQSRLMSSGTSGVEALYADQNLVVARDAQGNLLWSPTLNDQGEVQDGTLLLADGTLQTFRDGKVIRQVDPFGLELLFDSEGRAVAEIAADGTRSDYSYNPTTRTTHLPNGDLVQVYDAEGRLEKVAYPDGRVFTYTGGRITSAATAEGLIYSYSQTTGADGLPTATLNALPSGRITLSNGTIQVIQNGIVSSLIDPAGTQWTIASTANPFGRQALLQTGTVTDRFNFDAAGTLYAAATDRNLAGATPFTSPLQSFKAGALTNAGIVATDGKYLYVKPFNGSNKAFTKIGTGFGGTTAGQSYGTLTGSVSNTLSAAIGPDGFLYQPDPTNATRLERIDTASGAKSFVTVPAGILKLDTAKVEKGDVLITSDGRYVYNLSYHQTRNSTTLNGWTVRVFDPKNGWALVKEFTTGTSSFKTNGLTSDGTFLYALEWSGTNSARVAVIRISDGTLAQTWTANQATTTTVGGQYDWVNQRFWLGSKSTGKIYAYDDPNDLPLSSWISRTGSAAPVPAAQIPPIPAELVRKIIYNADGSVKEAAQGDGTVVRLADGLPEGLAAAGNSFSFLKDGVLRDYNSDGTLSSLTLSDQTGLTFQGETLTGIHLDDGTRVEDGVYGADSKLISGTVTLPDGRRVRYAEGQPADATLPDGSRVTYSDGQPSGLTLPDGNSYTLTLNEDSVHAELVEAGTGDALTSLTYSAGWILLEAVRGDGAHLSYVRPEPVEGRTDSASRLSTLTQADGTVISYAYDAAGRLTSTVAAPPDPADPAIRTEYAYDRIRKIYRGETLTYDYSYEFPADGTEITAVYEISTGLIKRYRDGLLISQTDPDGAETLYEYTANPAGYEDPLQTATKAVRTLSDGTIAHYSRSSDGAWTLSKLMLADGTELLPEEMNPPNLLGEFASLETWSSHSALDAPDGWKFGFDTGASIAQETSPENVHSGSSSVKLTTGAGGGDSFIYRDIAPMYSPELAQYEGKTVTFGAWVKTTDAGAALVIVLDDVTAGVSKSENHPGDGQWHFLTVSRLVGRGISKLPAYPCVTGVSKTAYFDDAVFIVGPAVLTRDFTSLLAEAALPNDPAALRRMVELGTLQLTQPARAESSSVRAEPVEAQSPVLARATVTYQGKEREHFTYTYSDDLTRVTDSNGVTRTYGADQRLAALEQPDGARYEVSYHRDLSEAQIQQLAALNPGDTAVAAVLSNPDGEEITVHRLAVEEEEELSPDTLVERVFDSNGEIISTTQAKGQTTLYEGGRPIRAFDSQGRLLTDYTYDEQGRLAKISLTGARRDLANEIAAARADLARKKADALEDLAQRKGLAIQDLYDRANAARAELSNQMNSLKLAWSDILPLDARGRAGEQAKGGAMNQILDAQAQVYVALSEVDTQYAQALGQLEAQVESVRQQAETESAAALDEINAQETEFGLQILRQEISTIVISAYRSVIGRDPSQRELDAEVQRLYDRYGADPEAAVDLADLTQRIAALPDYTGRVEQVAAIKQAVTAWLTAYVQAESVADNPDSVRAELFEALGLTPDQVVSLSASDIQRILDWLNSRSLHFGHSAFLALQEYILAVRPEPVEGQTALDLISLATQAILTDILVGVITPKVSENADLEISLFTLGHLARRYGAAATAARVSFEDLRGLVRPEPLEGRIIPAIAHVNGNHYIVVKAIAADGTVTYSEPNAGPGGETLTMTQAEFEKTWDGAVLAARAPPHAWQTLTDSEAQRITGSFFPLIFAALAWIGTAITTAISVAIGAITAIIGTLSAIVSSIFSIVGTVFSSIGSFLGGFGSFFSGFGAISQGLGGLFAGNLLGGLVGIVHGLAIAIPGGVLGLGLNIGVTKGLEALGVNPTIASLAGAFVSGGITGALNPIGVSSNFLSNFVSSGLTSTAIAGTQIGLVKAGLDPNLASIASIGVGTLAGSMLSGVAKLDAAGNIVRDAAGNPVIIRGFSGLSQTLSLQSGLAPTLAGELAFYGVQQLGASIGLDPRISQLAGIPIRNSVSAYLTRSSSEQLIESIGAGLARGATSIGLEFAADELDLDPLVGSIATATLSGSIEAMLEGRNPLLGVADTYTKSATGLLALGGPGTSAWERALYLSKINDFSNIIREQGIGSAFETYAASILHRQTIENIWKLGGIYDLLANRDQIEIRTNEEGIQVKRIYTSTQKQDYIDLALDDDRLLGKREGNIIMHCEYVKGPDGKFVLRNGETEILSEDGSYVIQREVIEDFKLAHVTKYDRSGNVIEEIVPVDSKGVFVNDQGQVTHGIRKNYVEGVTTTYNSGDTVRVELDRSYAPASAGEKQLLLDMGYTEENISGLRQIYTYAAEYGKHVLTSKILREDGSVFVANSPEAKEWLASVQSNTNRVWLYAQRVSHDGTPSTSVEIDKKKGVAEIDMKLVWPREPHEEEFIRQNLLTFLDLNRYVFNNNVNWMTAVMDAVPELAAVIANKDADFIFAPGVNSTGLTSDQLLQLKISLQTDKQVVVAHSAGTELAIRSMFAAKAEKYILVSPRMSPDALRTIMQETGVRPDQVIVVTARGDFPSWPLTGNLDYVDYGGTRWTSIHIESGPGIELNPLSSHPIGIQGWLEEGRYLIEVNGNRLSESKTLSEIYRNEVNK